MKKRDVEREPATTLAIAGQHSITAYKNTIWWWEMGHLWGWNVLQVAKLRRDGMEGGGTSVLATVQRKPGAKKNKKMDVFLSSLQISLWHSFHCFIKMPEKKKDRAYVFQEWESCRAPPKKPEPWKSVIYSTKLNNVWNTGWYLFQGQLYLHTPLHTHTNNIWPAEFSVHTVFYSELPLGLSLMWIQTQKEKLMDAFRNIWLA